MKKDNKNLLWGILAGSIVGSVTALLFAPKPGKELRKDIADGTTGAIEKVQEVAAQASDKSTELFGKAKDAVETVVTEVKEWSKQHIHSGEKDELVTVSGIAAEETETALELSDETEVSAVNEDAQAEAAVLGVEGQDGKGSGETL